MLERQSELVLPLRSKSEKRAHKWKLQNVCILTGMTIYTLMMLTNHKKFLSVGAFISSATPFCMMTIPGGGSICFFLLLGLAIIFFMQNKKWPDLFVDKAYPWFLTGLILWSMLIIFQMMVMGSWSGRTFEVILRFLSGLVILPFLVQIPSSFLKKIEWGIVLGAISSLIYALLTTSTLYSSPRAWNFFMCPIMFGNISLLLGFWSLLSLYWDDNPSSFKKAIKFLAFFAGVYTSVLSGSRGGWIAIPLLAILLFNFLKTHHYLNKKYKIIFFTGCIILSIISIGSVFNRLSQITHDIRLYQTGNVAASAGQRFEMWKGAFLIFKKNPVLGIGKGHLQEGIKQLADQGIISNVVTEYKHSHNEILFMMAEFGSAGLIALLLFYFGSSIHFYRCRHNDDLTIRTAAYMGLMLSGGYIVFGFTEVIFDRVKEIGFFVVMISIFLGLIARRKQELSHQPELPCCNCEEE